MDADYRRETLTTRTERLVVKTPLDWKNFGFVVYQVELELKELGRSQYDDACEVTVGDDEIIFSWPSGSHSVIADRPT